MVVCVFFFFCLFFPLRSFNTQSKVTNHNSGQPLDILLRKLEFLSQSFLQCDYHVEIYKLTSFVAQTLPAHAHCMLLSQNTEVFIANQISYYNLKNKIKLLNYKQTMPHFNDDT